MDIPTAHGPARAILKKPAEPSFLLVLTHGAGGGVETADLAAATRAGLAAGAAVARVTQAYRVRGARAPGSEARQDESWLDAITALRGRFPQLPLVQGGRSNGARVACRTAPVAGAAAVLALAFPLHPPGRPERTRAGELAAAGVRVLVLNGDRDPFGVPAGRGRVKVEVLAGETHALRGAGAEIERRAGAWLTAVMGGAGQRASAS